MILQIHCIQISLCGWALIGFTVFNLTHDSVLSAGLGSLLIVVSEVVWFCSVFCFIYYVLRT